MTACRRRLPAAAAVALVAGAGVTVPLPVNSASWFVEAGLRSEVTVTDNADFDRRGEQRDDVIFSLAPTFAIRGEGRRMRISGAFSLGAITYLNGTEESALSPVGSLAATIEAVDRWLFIDAGLSAARSLDNPLGPRPDGPSTFNRQNVNTARVSPYVERDLPGGMRLRLRSDNAWTETRGEAQPRDGVYAARHRFLFERDPRPLGWRLEAARTEERSEGADRVPTVDVARVALRAALGDQVGIGLRGGIERSEVLVEGEATFAGVEVVWRPTPRTSLDGFWEDRSFGSGYQVAFTHRSPFIALDGRATRDLTTFGSGFIEIPATGNLSALLDAALRTRVADPVERARAVEEFINRRGLPRALPGPVSVFSDELLLSNSKTMTLTLIGVRSTVAISGFHLREKSLSGSGFALIVGAARDIKQDGAALTYSLRLNSRAAASLSGRWTRTADGAGTFGAGGLAATTRQQTYRTEYTYQVGPRTSGFVGARHQIFKSSLINDTRETAGFAGLGHRF